MLLFPLKTYCKPKFVSLLVRCAFSFLNCQALTELILIILTLSKILTSVWAASRLESIILTIFFIIIIYYLFAQFLVNKLCILHFIVQNDLHLVDSFIFQYTASRRKTYSFGNLLRHKFNEQLFCVFYRNCECSCS